MMNMVIKGDYYLANVCAEFENFSEKNLKVYIKYFKHYKAYLNRETFAYCNIVEKGKNY